MKQFKNYFENNFKTPKIGITTPPDNVLIAK